MNLDRLVRDERTFFALSGQREAIIDLDKRLPEFVFRKDFNKYLPIEYEHINRPYFPSLLKDLADQHGDTRVNYVTIEPDPIKYYLDMHGFYGMASFSPLELAETYFPTMSRGNRADSFLHRGGDIGLFWGASLAWAIYCDRISWETAILATNIDPNMSKFSDVAVLSPVDLVDYLLSQYRRNPSVAENFVKRFVENYNFR